MILSMILGRCHEGFYYGFIWCAFGLYYDLQCGCIVILLSFVVSISRLCLVMLRYYVTYDGQNVTLNETEY